MEASPGASRAQGADRPAKTRAPFPRPPCAASDRPGPIHRGKKSGLAQEIGPCVGHSFLQSLARPSRIKSSNDAAASARITSRAIRMANPARRSCGNHADSFHRLQGSAVDVGGRCSASTQARSRLSVPGRTRRVESELARYARDIARVGAVIARKTSIVSSTERAMGPSCRATSTVSWLRCAARGHTWDAGR